MKILIIAPSDTKKLFMINSIFYALSKSSHDVGVIFQVNINNKDLVNKMRLNENICSHYIFDKKHEKEGNELVAWMHGFGPDHAVYFDEEDSENKWILQYSNCDLTVIPRENKEHFLEDTMLLIQNLISNDTDFTLRVNMNSLFKSEMIPFFQNMLDNNKSNIILSINNGGDWGVKNYILLSRLLSSTGYNVILLNEKKDIGITNLFTFFTKSAINLTGVSLEKAFNIIEFADFFIGENNIFAHISSNLGKPTVILSSDRDELKYRPIGKEVTVLAVNSDKDFKNNSSQRSSIRMITPQLMYDTLDKYILGAKNKNEKSISAG